MRKREDRQGFRQHKVSRQISNLQKAHFAEIAPHAPARLTGIRAKGKAYERRLGRHLEALVTSGGILDGGKLHAGRWIRFHDDNGPGYAQPDFIVETNDLTFILDAKLTHTPLARPQILGLYLPLVRFIFSDNPIVCVETFHNVGSKELPKPIIGDIDQVFDTDADLYHWHWLG